ncbi:MAG: Gfo/Idh/MocA family protein [Saprospiraceae bacterium]
MQIAPITNKYHNAANITSPKLGFAGVGWIGRSRLEAIAQHTNATIAAVFDPAESAINQSKTHYENIQTATSFEHLLTLDLDGIVIATPSALHEQQTLQALEKGLPVFCQKPLARTAEATRRLVEKAREKNVLLGVDFSYRDALALQKVNELIKHDTIGEMFHANLIFHNAYGPDKSWYYDPALSGGGCVMDLGIHLVDMLFYLFPDLKIKHIRSHLYNKGKLICNTQSNIEDFATVQIGFENDGSAQLTCSWNVSAGQDAVIEATFFGTKGGICFKNVNGSFYDFQTELYHGTSKNIIIAPPDEWMGRTAALWAMQLADNPSFDESALTYIKVAETLDRIYNIAENKIHES